MVVLTYILARLLRRVSHRATSNARVDFQLVLLISRVVYIGVVALGLLSALAVVAPQWVTPVIGAVGLLGLAFGLAFQEVLRNWISGFFLLLERPIRIGDRITVKEFTGEVETVALRVTVLRTEDGDRVLVPNSEIYTSTVVLRDRPPASSGPRRPKPSGRAK